MPLFEPILSALQNERVRFVVVGGVAVVLHGVVRLTVDLDLALDLSPNEAEKAITVLTRLGLRPQAPVPALEFADPEKRRSWVEEKDMKVFSFWHPRDPLLVVDLFAENPIPFEELWERSKLVALEAMSVRIASIPDLIRMKTLADRPQDLLDIEELRKVERRGGPSP